MVCIQLNVCLHHAPVVQLVHKLDIDPSLQHVEENVNCDIRYRPQARSQASEGGGSYLSKGGQLKVNKTHFIAA